MGIRGKLFQLGQLKTVFSSSFYPYLCSRCRCGVEKNRGAFGWSFQIKPKSSATESFIFGIQTTFLHDVREKQLRSALDRVTQHCTPLPNVVMPHCCFNLKHSYFTTVISTCFRAQYRRHSTSTHI